MNNPTSFEEHLAHHAAAIDDISKQMAEQWQAIRRLERKLDLIADHLKAMQDNGDAPPSTAPPPHY